MLRASQLQKYNTSVNDYTSNIELPLDEYCNGFTVKNAGTSGLTVQGEVLLPGESLSVGGNYGEVLEGRIPLVFDNTGVNLAYFRQKFYVKLNDC